MEEIKSHIPAESCMMKYPPLKYGEINYKTRLTKIFEVLEKEGKTADEKFIIHFPNLSKIDFLSLSKIPSVLVFTTTHYYELSEDLNFTQKIPYDHLHHAELCQGEKLLNIHFYQEEKEKKLPLTFQAESKEHRNIVGELISSILIKYWRNFFHKEIKLLPDEDLYQYHAKVWKINRKGQSQLRFIVLTDQFLCNLKYSKGEYKNKWRIPIKALVYVGFAAAKPLNLKLKLDKKIQKEILSLHKLKSVSKVDREFQLSDEYERTMMLFHLRRIFCQLNDNRIYLNVKEVPK
mmetsp:Transcript_51307/g.58784  ORF Transcript_51307/g.58784 Transcript_51307/m.58784 type:complete len:291 (-) Transcript_51307:133-1005(-)